jgi:ATP-dependent RNA helicase DeaD
MNYEKFKNLGLSDAILKELQKKGFEEPTEIQEKVIPVLMTSNSDIIGQAQTGTGKTAAFGLPLIEKIEKKNNAVQALVLTPTRELAIQVSEEINSFKGKKKFRIIPIYGGQSITEQLRRLQSGVDVVVGTPGRILDHIKRKSLLLNEVMYVVLDEADEMLNMGFIDDVEEILSHTNPGRRTLLFSATMPDRIKSIAAKYMRDHVVISAKTKLTVDLTDQIYFEVNNADKFESLCRIIDIENDFYGMVFCRTKAGVDELYSKLIDRGYEAEGIHGDMSQSQRERIMEKFKKRRASILVATDVAARGLDVTDLTHVINYSLPQDPESYVHRIGRTGRAGKKGIAITFISPSEYRKLMHISSETKTKIRKEKIPGINEIINIKKSKIKSELTELIESGSHEAYIETALQMIEEHDPVNVLAALLKYSLEDVLNEKKYKDIAIVSGKGSGKGKKEEFDGRGLTRLFVSFGKKDGINPKKLLKLVNNATGTPSGKITGIIIKDSYSFLTVPFGEAEKIINAFSHADGKKPVIQKAAEGQKPAKNKKDKKKNRKR